MTVQLRPYQRDLVSGVYRDWNQGAQNVLAVLPTGGGKSVCVTEVIQDMTRLGNPGIIKAHRNELVSQMSMHVARWGIPHRIIGPDSMIRAIAAEHRDEFGGRSYIDQGAIVTVAGVDTLIARKDNLNAMNFDPLQQKYWITDEAHHVLAKNKWGSAAGLFTNAIGLGVTATPERADGEGLGRYASGLMDSMVLGPSMRDLINMGALTDYEIVAPVASFEMDESEITASGDFSQKKMQTKAKQSQIVGDVVANWCKFAYNKRTIVFSTDVETSEKLAAQFQAFDISAAAVSAKTNSTVRTEVIKRFRDGRITVLINVDLFGEGFDVPSCECVVMARPTASLGVYLQQFGRALRLMAGKTHGLIIDHVSNWKLHGLPDQPRQWTLDSRIKRTKKEKDPEEYPQTRCTECSKLYLKFMSSCPWCGHEPIPAGRGTPEEVEGDLMLLDRETLEQMRRDMELDSAADLAERAGFAAGPAAAAGAANRQIEKIAAQRALKEAIDQWAGIQLYKGRTLQEAYKRFHYAAGMDVLTACGKQHKRSDYDALRMKVEGWIADALQHQ